MESRRTVLKYPDRRVGCIGLSGWILWSIRAPAQQRKHQAEHRVHRGRRAPLGRVVVRGQKLLHTPNMDRIAREGCTFRNAFVVNALCLPSRATMLTGMYSHTTGAVSNVEGKIPARFPLVSDLLQKAGYETAFLGKSHIEGALMEHNWDYYFGFVGQADYYRPKITEGFRGQVRAGEAVRRRVRGYAAHAQSRRVAQAEADQAILHVPVVLCAACAVLQSEGHGQRPEWRANTLSHQHLMRIWTAMQESRAPWPTPTTRLATPRCSATIRDRSKNW